ncbi:MAG: HAD family hydrolase [Spirochaetes bacterium]|nr:MAG: HAD family hydrolase [Spirochaetota bacterium]
MSTLCGIIFDLDGTLLDTLRDIADSMNTALRALGYPSHPVDDYRLMIGTGVDDLARRSLPEGVSDPAIIQKTISVMREEYGKRWADTTRPYEGAQPLLRALREAGVPMAVLSNKPQEFTEMCVRRFLDESSFSIVMGSSPDFPRKPDPAAALHIAKVMGIDAAALAFAGDSGTDMDTAAYAGMYAVGVLWGFRKRQELVDHGARYLAAHPGDILKLFSGDAR